MAETDDLAEFLRACIAEDEEAARVCAAVYPPPWELTERGWVAYVKADAPNFREVARLDDQSVSGGDAWLGDALQHIAHWDPKRALDKCVADRRIVEIHSAGEHLCPSAEALEDGLWSVTDQDVMTPCPTLRLLALPYAGRPGWREKWKP